MKLMQHDVIQLRAVVELPVHNGAQVIVNQPNGTQVRLEDILHLKPGEIHSGDPVTKTAPAKGKTAAAITFGTVKHRDDAMAWVVWDNGSETLESVETLARS